MAKILVVANETAEAKELLAALHELEGQRSSTYRVLVPAHSLASRPTAVWTQEGAMEAAKERLMSTLALLHREGLDADGVIGDMNPVNAVRDALLDFDADVIVVSTHPLEKSRWLRRNVVDRIESGPGAGRRVIHVVSHVEEPAHALGTWRS